MKRVDPQEFMEWLMGSIIFAVVALLIVLSFTSGCCSAKCTKTIYTPVEVKVPVPVEGPALPLPEPPDCGEPPAAMEDWRESARWLKGCYDVLLVHIEKLQHIIVSYNESRVP